MTQTVRSSVRNGIGHIVLDRPKALNSLSLEMIRALSAILHEWRASDAVRAVLVYSSSEKAFCAGGDIRFFHAAGHATVQGGSALLEDFFSEEYALNHLVHHYPKPYVALMDGVVMGGGMGIAQAGPACRMRVVTERTRMAMPEVNIGLFPDVGGSHFLSRATGASGIYLGVVGETIRAADALYAGLADVFVPAAELPALIAAMEASEFADVRKAVTEFSARFAAQADPASSGLAVNRAAIDHHFSGDSVVAIRASLAEDESDFARQTLLGMATRSPLMMCVTLELVRRGASLSLADCLRMERALVRRCFEHGEVLEGVRALVIDKDNAPRWNPPSLDEVRAEMVTALFDEVWPGPAHPLRDLA